MSSLDAFKELQPILSRNSIEFSNIFVPGRVCLLGEHSDWASLFRGSDVTIPNGRCLVYGTTCGLHTKARLLPLSPEELGSIRKTFQESGTTAAANCDVSNAQSFFFMKSVVPVSVSSNTVEEQEELKIASTLMPLNEDLLTRECKAGFFSYVYGTMAVMLKEYHAKLESKNGSSEQQPFLLEVENYFTDLPVQKGLSSSAAACVTVVRVLNTLFNLSIPVEKEMEYAFQGEILTGSECGRMDQCVAFGQACVSLEFDGSACIPSALNLPAGTPLYFVVTDLRAGKDTKKILRDLSSCFPLSHPVAQNSSSSNNSHHAIPEEVQQRVRSFLWHTSRDYVEEAATAINAADSAKLGTIFTEYQRAFDGHLCAACTELVSPKLHKILNDARVQELSLGGKGVGSQGDGSAQFICSSEEKQEELMKYIDSTYGCHSMKFTLVG